METNLNTIREENAKNFLLFAYFGNEMKDKVVKNCARRAYLDFNRTLKFNKGIDESYRYLFREKLIDYIADQIEDLLDSQNQKIFNEIHNLICINLQNKAQKAKIKTETGDIEILNKIEQGELEESSGKSEESNGRDSESFYYGQAQKWLNMTLKYMWMIGALEDNVVKFLHIPVDSYIIKAVCEEKNIRLPLKKKKAYGLEKFISWSKWKEKDYCDFQEDLQTMCKNKGKLPLEWENQTWIEIAKDRKDKENDRLKNVQKKKRLIFRMK